MLRTPLRWTFLAVAAIGVGGTLSSCGSSPSNALPHVVGAYGSTPTMTFPSSSAPSTLQVKVLKKSNGPLVKKGDLLLANYVGQIWGGKIFDSSFSRHQPASFQIGVGKVIPGWDKALVGAHVGSRMLLVIPPKDGYGAGGQPSAGITGKDTIAFVVDLLGSYSSSSEGQQATSTLVASGGGVKVTWPPNSPPTAHLVHGVASPRKLTSSLLSRGSGSPLIPGVTVLQFVVLNGKTGAILQSTWVSGVPSVVLVSRSGSLAPLVGVPVGSRLVLDIPKTKSEPALDVVIDVVGEPANL
jgi:peptidylprolyl isomerase